MGPRGEEHDSTIVIGLTDDAHVAVVAHGLLNSAAVIMGAAAAIEAIPGQDRGEDLLRWTQRIRRHAEIVADGLRTMTRGLPPGTLLVLDNLNAESQTRQLD